MTKDESRDRDPNVEMDLVGVYDNDSLQIAGLVADSANLRPDVEAVAELEKFVAEASQIQLISYTTT